MTGCEVCDGSGLYPVFNRMGLELYSISCPECFGEMRALTAEQDDFMNEANKAPVPDAPKDNADG